MKTVSLAGKGALRLNHLSRRAGRTDHLRLTVSLPLAAGNPLQGQSDPRRLPADGRSRPLGGDVLAGR